MLKKTFLAGFCAAALFSCSNEAANSETAQTEPAATEQAAVPTYESFGEEIDAEGTISYQDLQLKMAEAEADSVAVKFTGVVEEVCQAKGCWMTIASDDEGQEPIMVRFKDYGFFMPKDIAGKKVIMEGFAFTEETPVDELRHYAEDAGKSAEEIASITEPKRETKFLASGVLLVKE
ncbi:DUF4920 domain-containing protein [Phaeodactylibacter luteus]|uniref:DUF4920 domain-containing protein n=1 Tax=Phaeodactylibacter luteus TaxID=1564516 RepID=A0A5C6S1S6_9BACT|nr:DUF4920 domain-containing protein [Phaeodactylibacter luteus]TXB67592.1 DUF4920 domain-containing protein [Phaeodactylibacter luteus]